MKWSVVKQRVVLLLPLVALLRSFSLMFALLLPSKEKGSWMTAHQTMVFDRRLSALPLPPVSSRALSFHSQPARRRRQRERTTVSSIESCSFLPTFHIPPIIPIETVETNRLVSLFFCLFVFARCLTCKAKGSTPLWLPVAFVSDEL